MGEIKMRTLACMVLAACCPHIRAAESTTVSVSVPEQVRALLLERARVEFPDARIDAEIGSLDPRLTLADCSKLTLTPRAQKVYGRIPVAAQCHAPYAWSVFLTGEVSVVVPVVVSVEAVNRGTTLSRGHLALEPRDLGTLRNQYLTRVDLANGLETKSPLRADQVIYATQLKEPLAVRRGERVTIMASRGAVQINAQGEALQNGMTGSQIRVKNLQSERIVHAWVRAQGLVATSPAP
jgi:flagella basal body P-ring formation protein FlgA